jgi:hypothetical protein
LFITHVQKYIAMKIFTSFLPAMMIIVASQAVHAQNTFPSSGAAGIGTITPDASSLLDVTSTAKGVLVPRMTQTQRNAIASPATGLLVFQTDHTPGFCYYSGTAWTAISTKGANTSLNNLKAPTAVNVNLLPSTDSSIDLGSSSLRWKNIYLASKLFIGGSAFLDNSGSANTLIGNTGNTKNTGRSNTVVGSAAFNSNTTGSDNTANGVSALTANTTGYNNTANGGGALSYNKTGHDNTADGLFALLLNSSGFENTADGDNAGSNVTTGSNNTFIGALANCGSAGILTNSTAIGYNAFITASNNFVFGSSDVVGWGFGVEAGSRAIKVGSTSSNGNGAYLTTGGVWTDISDVNKKENITELDKNSVLQKVLQLHISQWKYKGTENEYHIGPMAADFHRLFQVGDDNSISSMDKTGVLFLAVQQLSKQNDSLKNENADLQKQFNDLKALVLSIQQAQQQYSPCSSSAAGIQQSIASITDAASLQQNIPNPFNHTTTIGYSLPDKFSSAQIIILDKNGKQLKQINIVGMRKGVVNVDASTLSSGAYNYSLIVDGRLIASKQMEHIE